MQNSSSLPLRLWFGLAVLGFGLSACQSDEDYYGTAAPSPYQAGPVYERMAPIAPPAYNPDQQPYPRATDPAHYVWRPGHWKWTGNDYVWQDGYFMARPSMTALWSHDQWVQRRYGWTFVPGHWE
jgi:hypothetical protein